MLKMNKVVPFSCGENEMAKIRLTIELDMVHLARMIARETGSIIIFSRMN